MAGNLCGATNAEPHAVGGRIVEDGIDAVGQGIAVDHARLEGSRDDLSHCRSERIGIEKGADLRARSNRDGISDGHVDAQLHLRGIGDLHDPLARRHRSPDPIGDGHGGAATYTVSVEVTPVNDAPQGGDLSVTATEDTPLSGHLPVATDAEGSRLTYRLAAGPVHGLVRVNADGTFSYTPDHNFNGTDVFTYAVSDGTDTSTYTVTVTVDPVNDAPVGSNLSISVREGAGASGTLPPAIDPEGDTVSYGLGTQAGHGTAIVNADGTYTYTPAAGYSGADSFTYTVGDGSAATTYTVTVSVTAGTVNQAPIGSDATVDGVEDTPLRGHLPVATDPEGAAISYGLGAQATHGTVTVNADGSYSYTPNHNFNGADSFTYTVSDGQTTSSYTITLDIAAVNDAPLGSDTSVSAVSGVPKTGHLPPAIDPEGDAVTYGLGRPAGHGTVTINPDGS